MCERLLGAFVSSEGRLDSVELGLNGRAVDYLFPEKGSQIIFLRPHIKVELEMARIDSPDAEIGDIAHDTDGQGSIEPSLGIGGWRLAETAYSCWPTGAVIIFRIQTLAVGLPEHRDHSHRLLGRFAVLQPGRGVVRSLIKALHQDAIVGEIRPPKI